MSKTCRDCGNVLVPGVRGCQRCALNLEAEDLIGRFVWRRLLPGVLLLGLIVAVSLVFMMR